MLRTLLLLLVLGNLLFLAWGRGWLEPMLPAPHAGQREPDRLAAQVHPERLTVLGPGIAAAPAPTFACLELGPLAPAQLEPAEAALAAAGLGAGGWERVAAEAGSARLRVPAASPEQQAALRALALPGGSFQPCPAPPGAAAGGAPVQEPASAPAGQPGTAPGTAAYPAPAAGPASAPATAPGPAGPR